MSRQASAFEDAINKQIDYFRNEYDLTIAEAVGVLALAQHQLCQEASDVA